MSINIRGLDINIVGRQLINEISKVCERLNADSVVVKKVMHNKYAVVELYEGNDCIDWNYVVNC